MKKLYKSGLDFEWEGLNWLRLKAGIHNDRNVASVTIATNDNGSTGWILEIHEDGYWYQYELPSRKELASAEKAWDEAGLKKLIAQLLAS